MDTESTIIVGTSDLEHSLPIALTSCWGSYDRTEGSVRLAEAGTTLYLRYMMGSPQLRRMATAHNQDVCDDSSVGAILQRSDSHAMIHIQCSAAGFVKVSSTDEEGNETLMDSSLFEGIFNNLTLFENTNTYSRWSIQLSVDLKLLGLLKEGETLETVKIRGNFYSCGEKLDQRYYLLAHEVGTLEPDLVNPAYFADLILS